MHVVHLYRCSCPLTPRRLHPWIKERTHCSDWMSLKRLIPLDLLIQQLEPGATRLSRQSGSGSQIRGSVWTGAMLNGGLVACLCPTSLPPSSLPEGCAQAFIFPIFSWRMSQSGCSLPLEESGEVSLLWDGRCFITTRCISLPFVPHWRFY